VVALFLLRWSPRFLGQRASTGTLVLKSPVTLASQQIPQLKELVAKHLQHVSFDSLSTTDGETVITWSFSRVSLESAAQVEEQLRSLVPSAAVGIYYHGYANA
jgi:hypothetical protein